MSVENHMAIWLQAKEALANLLSEKCEPRLTCYVHGSSIRPSFDILFEECGNADEANFEKS